MMWDYIVLWCPTCKAWYEAMNYYELCPVCKT